MVFEHEGLLKIDEERNTSLKVNQDAAHTKYSSRVTYKTDLKHTLGKKKIVKIIDEGDERMFRDLEEFYNGTKSEKIITICLTATPFEGDSDGL